MARGRGKSKGIGRSITNTFSHYFRFGSNQKAESEKWASNEAGVYAAGQNTQGTAQAEQNIRQAQSTSLNNENYHTAPEIGTQPLSSETKEQVNQMSPESRDAALQIGSQVKQSILDRYAEMAEQQEKQAQGREHDLEHDRD